MNEMDRAVHALDVVVCQHHDLKNRVDSLRCQAARAVNDEELAGAINHIRKALIALREVMVAHFSQEAEGGYLEEAVARSPRLAAAADACEREHPLLVRTIGDLIVMAGDAPNRQTWEKLAFGVNMLTKKMLDHESVENRILREGFNEDPALFE
jgi:hypothetical protein